MDGVNSEAPVQEKEVIRVLRGQAPPQDTKTKEDLNSAIYAAMALAHHVPLGEDRAYRKYWRFASLPGLYVEHFELNPGPCLPKSVLKLFLINLLTVDVRLLS